MKKREVVKRIATEAKRQDVTWELHRQGGNHEVWSLGGVKIPIARHNEIDDQMARVIFRECETVLGEGWWK